MPQIQDFKIRYAIPEDKTILLPIIKKVINKVTDKTDYELIERLFNKGLENDEYSLLVLVNQQNIPKGYVFCTVTNLYFSYITVACCLSIWVEEDSRQHSKDMIKAFEAWSKYKGADKMMLATFDKVSPEKLGKVYSRLGYSTQEVQYWKDVE